MAYKVEQSVVYLGKISGKKTQRKLRQISSSAAALTFSRGCHNDVTIHLPHSKCVSEGTTY